jgi:hypothetical protein
MAYARWRTRTVHGIQLTPARLTDGTQGWTAMIDGTPWEIVEKAHKHWRARSVDGWMVVEGLSMADCVRSITKHQKRSASPRPAEEVIQFATRIPAWLHRAVKARSALDDTPLAVIAYTALWTDLKSWLLEQTPEARAQVVALLPGRERVAVSEAGQGSGQERRAANED